MEHSRPTEGVPELTDALGHRDCAYGQRGQRRQVSGSSHHAIGRGRPHKPANTHQGDGAERRHPAGKPCNEEGGCVKDEIVERDAEPGREEDMNDDGDEDRRERKEIPGRG